MGKVNAFVFVDAEGGRAGRRGALVQRRAARSGRRRDGAREGIAAREGLADPALLACDTSGCNRGGRRADGGTAARSGAVLLGKTNRRSRLERDRQPALWRDTIRDISRTSGGSMRSGAAQRSHGRCCIWHRWRRSIRIPAAFSGIFGMKQPGQSRSPAQFGMNRMPDR